MLGTIEKNQDALIQQILADMVPDYLDRSTRYIEKSLRDIRYSLLFTLEGLKHEKPSIIKAYFSWLAVALHHAGIDKAVAGQLYVLIQTRLAPHLSLEQRTLLDAIDPNTFSVDENGVSYVTKPDTATYLRYVLNKDRHAARAHILKLRETGSSLKDIYLDILQPSLYEVGRLWQTGTIHVADEHLATVITQSIMANFYEEIFASPKHGKKLLSTAIGTELHEIGIRMVTDFFELDGFQTHYLGANMPPDEIVRFAESFQPDLVCLSVTLPLHLSALQETLDKLRERLPGGAPKILIGGQAFSGDESLYNRFGADGHARNAASALEVGRHLVGL
ncbi:MAG: hypothetical protein EA374_02015 [Acholeplasmatales bacterium]|nr:MAG: hypothetical protein EA374_02015 [Acholeplasmatales bacterium]